MQQVPEMQGKRKHSDASSFPKFAATGICENLRSGLTKGKRR